VKELVLYKGLRKTKLLLYTDIDQLSAERFSKVNKYWMLDDELGNSFEDIDKIHITRILLSLDDKEKAKRVLDNLRVLIHNIINEVNPESLAFVCLVHSIDGLELTDLSEDNLKRTLKLLSDKGLMYSELKKKLKRSEREFMLN
jgi:DNA-binding transcriptional ArsR family regulator